MTDIKKKMEQNGNLDKYNAGMENLGANMFSDKEHAREAQRKSVESRKRNARMREELATLYGTSSSAVAKALKDLSHIDPRDVLQANMITAQAAGDYEQASKIATSLMPYEHASLQKVTQTTKDVKDLSDEELSELILAHEEEERTRMRDELRQELLSEMTDDSPEQD